LQSPICDAVNFSPANACNFEIESNRLNAAFPARQCSALQTGEKTTPQLPHELEQISSAHCAAKSIAASFMIRRITNSTTMFFKKLEKFISNTYDPE